PRTRAYLLEGNDAVKVPGEPLQSLFVIRFVNGNQVPRGLLIDREQVLPPRLLRVGNSAAGCIQQRRDLVHSAFPGNVGGGPSFLPAAKIRIGAVLQKELDYLQRRVLVLRQPEERSIAPGSPGAARFGGQDVAQPVDPAKRNQIPNVPAAPRQ